jgi:hypothetical protein
VQTSVDDIMALCAIRQSKTILARSYLRETERSSLLTRIAATGGVSLCARMKS